MTYRSPLAWALAVSLLAAACGDDDLPRNVPSTSTSTSSRGGGGGVMGGGGQGGAPARYAVAVEVRGLRGALTLGLMGDNASLRVTEDGTYELGALPDDTTFEVTVEAPVLQTCTISDPTGTIAGGNATGPVVQCATHLLFWAQSSTGDGELYASDLTESGTRRIADINPAGGSFPREMTMAPSGLVFFSADDGTSGRELWVTDGTEAGTRMLELGPGANDGSVDDIALFGNEVHFAGASPSEPNNVELWVTDGSAQGTALRHELTAGTAGSFPLDLIPVDGNLYLEATLADTDDHLMVLSQGQVRDLGLATDGDQRPGPNGKLYFTRFDGSIGRELSVTDGTVAGTGVIADLNPSGSSNPSGITPLGNRVIFAADDGTHGRELFTELNGTISLVLDIRPGAAGSSPEPLGVVGNNLLFTADDDTHGRELWITDGTAAGTSLLADMTTGSDSTSFNAYGSVDGDLIVRAWPTSDYSDVQIWRINPSGPALVFDPPDGLLIYEAVGAALGEVCFRGVSSSDGAELWCTDGTAGGTRQIIDLCPGTCSGLISNG